MDFDFWAKTDPESGTPARTVTEHSFRAGAVGERLWATLGEPMRSLLPLGTVALTALHDIGKLTIGFQLKCPRWQPSDELRAASLREGGQNSISRHATLSQLDLGKRLPKAAAAWARAVGAHHGAFVEAGAGDRELLAPYFRPLRDALAERVTQRFGPLPDVSPSRDVYARNAQFCCLAGFIVLTDWIASNEDWFPLASPALFGSPFTDEMMQSAEQKAREIVGALHLATPPLKPGLAFSDYVPGNPAPFPVQRTALEHIAGPGLYIVEAAMGKGKTEAALAAAYQNIAGGTARGFYFALPTQLTSNEIHRRTRDIFSRMVEDATTLPLAHSASWLTAPERLTLHPAVPAEADADEERRQAVEHIRAARAWLTARRALLAPFGVGTIDQALMATLPVKFAPLRLFGLAGKVVIFDEVHSYDTYTGTVLEELIRLLLELRCAVIVLSATLTRRQRESLLRAVTETVDGSDPRWSRYPLLSVARKGEPARPIEIEAGEDKPKTVHVVHVGPELPEDLEAAILEQVERGACVLIVRNTVALAQGTYRRWKWLLTQSDDKERVGLLHSRFPYFQRFGRPEQENDGGREARWVERLGKNRAHRPRHGCVLVATQVVEQSVDVDADLLITDLCPTDQLLQRIGRLHRHDGARAKSITRAEVILLHPALPEENEPDPTKWKRALKPHGNLYAPYVLLRSRKLWLEKTAITLPDDIRPCLEATYADATPDEPVAWTFLAAELRERREGRMLKAQAFARSLAKPPEPDDENTAPTRWNDCPTLDLVLLRDKGETGPGGTIRLRFLDGTTLQWHSLAGWKGEVARAVFVNTVRIPYYLWPPQCETPAWLAAHTHGLAGAAWTTTDGTLVQWDTEDTIPLRYSAEEGVSELPRSDGSLTRTGRTEEPDDWAEDDDDSMA